MVDNKSIVIENGSYSIKYGFSNEKEPKFIKKSNNYENNGFQNYPIENGQISNWNLIENIWSDIIDNQLEIETNDYNVLLTESPITTKNQKEKITEIMFEKFNFKSISIVLDSVLSLYSTGKKTGVIVDCGHSGTNIVPIYEGYKINHGICRLNIGGQDINNYLNQLLIDSNILIENQSLLYDIKEKFSFINSSNIENVDNNDSNIQEFEISNGNKIYLNNNQHIKCGEILFKPNLFKIDNVKPLHEAIYKSIESTDIDIRKNLNSSVMLFGGTSMINGLSERVKNELKSISPKYKINVVTTDDRNYSSWKGGAIYCDLLTTNQSWIDRTKYDEMGPSTIYN